MHFLIYVWQKLLRFLSTSVFSVSQTLVFCTRPGKADAAKISTLRSSFATDIF